VSIFNQFINSAARQVGRNVANDVYYRNRTSTVKSKDLICYSTQGYQEGDVEIIQDKNWRREFTKWYAWLIMSIAGLVPYLGVLVSFFWVPNLFRTFFKKYQMHFYNFKWNVYKVQDKRTKEGIREIKNLDMVYSSSSNNPPYLRNKVEAILLVAIPLYLCIWSTEAIKKSIKEDEAKKASISKVGSLK